MAEVERWEGIDHAHMRPHADGYYVRYADYADKEAEVEQLKHRLDQQSTSLEKAETSLKRAAFRMKALERERSDLRVAAGTARTAASDAIAKATLAQAQLAECFRLTGADPDGASDEHLAGYAIQEVARLRQEADAHGDAGIAFTEAVEALLDSMRASGSPKPTEGLEQAVRAFKRAT